MKLHPAFLLLLCLVVAAVPAMAQYDIYDNGPLDGQTLGWTINFGFAVSDQFTISGNTPVNGMSFWDWLIPGDTLASVEVQIGSAAFGNELLDVTVNPTASNCFTNGFGYNVCDETASFSPINLGAGSYWMTLSNATVPSGDPTYWDMNSGPSAAQENTIGTIPSESFTIFGTQATTSSTCGCCAASPQQCPEPSTLVMLGSGIVGLGTMVRRKLRS